MESDDAPTTKGEAIVDTDEAFDGTVVAKGEDSQTPQEKTATAGNKESMARCPRDTSDDTAVEDDVGGARVATTVAVAANETQLNNSKRKGLRDSSSDPSCNHPAAGDASKKARIDTDVDNNNNNNNNIDAQNDDNSTSASTAIVSASSSSTTAVQTEAGAAADFNERTKMAMNKFVEEHKCPLTTELLCDPVTAEDGHNYEREMIEILINDAHNTRSKKSKKTLRSPRTNEPMGKEIKSDVSLRNTIQNFIESGLIGGEVADSWRQRKLIIDTKKKAEEGDPDAMQCLGQWYDGGLHGLTQSEGLARKWLTKADSTRVSQAMRRVREDNDLDAMNDLGMWYSEGDKGLDVNEKMAFKYFRMLADRNDARGMAQAGIRLADGVGTKEDINAGIGLTLRAADGKSTSDLGCYCMGIWYHEGMYGLCADESKAEHYLNKVVDGSCTFLHLGLEWEDEARERLDRIKKNQEKASSNNQAKQ